MLFAADIIITAPRYKAAAFQPRLDAGAHTIVLEIPHLRGARNKKGDYLFGGQITRTMMWDNVNNHALHPEGEMERWEKYQRFAPLKPWKTGCGGYAVVLGQLSSDATQLPIKRRWGTPQAFLQDMVDRLREKLSIPVYFKAHPEEMKVFGKKYFRPTGAVDVSSQPMDKVLDQAYLAVIANSGAGLLALREGVPVLAADPGFMGFRCSLPGLDNLGDLPLVDRTPCFNHVAWSQWGEKEMVAGIHALFNPDYYDPAVQMRQPRVEQIRSCSRQVLKDPNVPPVRFPLSNFSFASRTSGSV